MADKITKWTDEELISIVKPDMEQAGILQSSLEKDRAEYYKRYMMEKYGNERDGFSQSIAPVIHDNHKWTMANIMDIFTDDFFILKGEDEVRAGNFQKLIYYQMFRKQDGYRKFYDFIWETDLFPFGVLKCYYKEDFDLVNTTHEFLTVDEMAALKNEPGVVISKYDEDEDELGEVFYSNVKVVQKKVSYAGPHFFSVPGWEFFYTPDCKVTDWGAIEGRLVYQRTIKTLNDVRKKEKAKIYRAGTFDKLKEKYLESFNTPQDKAEYLFNVDDTPEIDPQAPSEERESILNRLVTIDELYFKLDVDSDGLLENVVMDVCDDVVCRIEENPYGRPPFRIGHIDPEPHKVRGVAMPRLLDNDQKIQTNLLRLIQDSAAIDCYKNPVTNDTNMFNMLQDRKPFAVIKGDPARLGEVKTSAPSEFILKAMEMCRESVEQKTGMTRYNQGMDASSLNKTATGIDAIMAASGKPLRLVARLLGNGAIMGLIRDFILINQLFPPQTDIKILGTDITVNPDDMTGEHDVEIDIGVSPAEKQALANQMDLLVQFGTQAGVPMGIMTPLHIMKAQRKKYKYLGVRVDDLMLSEKEFLQQQEQAKQNPPKPDIKEYVQLDKLYPLLTPMEQAQILQSFGVQPDPQRQSMPATALSGQEGPFGGPPVDQSPEQQAQLHAVEMRRGEEQHRHDMRRGEEKHRMSMAQQAQAHRLKLAQTAMDMQQKAKQPYPQGVKR